METRKRIVHQPDNTYYSHIEFKHEEIIRHFLYPPRPKMLIKVLNHIYNHNRIIGICITPSYIIKILMRYYNLSKTDLLSKSRSSELVKYRQIGMYLMRKYTKMSLARIGKIFDRDHSTVICSIKKVEIYYEIEKKYKYELDELMQVLENKH